MVVLDTIYQLDNMRMTDCLENVDFAFQILKQLRRQLLSSYSLDCYRSAGGTSIALVNGCEASSTDLVGEDVVADPLPLLLAAGLP